MSFEIVNDGVEVSTKALGKVVVKEFTLKQVCSSLPQIIEMVQELGLEGQEGELVNSPLDLFKNPKTADIVNKLVATAIEQPVDKVADLGVKDLLLLTKAFLKVNDIKEITSLFLELAGNLKDESQKSVSGS